MKGTGADDGETGDAGRNAHKVPGSGLYNLKLSLLVLIAQFMGRLAICKGAGT